MGKAKTQKSEREKQTNKQSPGRIRVVFVLHSRALHGKIRRAVFCQRFEIRLKLQLARLTTKGEQVYIGLTLQVYSVKVGVH